ncbi:hypothetical protein P9911_029555 [Klebsiella oxytoca]|uniref:hypothetical protein n=1 Tax=Klebsiella oxytoca TaxID=571 RepID=UPI00254D591F|nr:hypothetical protein [Klebsiella oxytoca]MEC5509950.1 hypothetical protein [Klebsiella oxytoca]
MAPFYVANLLPKTGFQFGRNFTANALFWGVFSFSSQQCGQLLVMLRFSAGLTSSEHQRQIAIAVSAHQKRQRCCMPRWLSRLPG